MSDAPSDLAKKVEAHCREATAQARGEPSDEQADRACVIAFQRGERSWNEAWKRGYVDGRASRYTEVCLLKRRIAELEDELTGSHDGK